MLAPNHVPQFRLTDSEWQKIVQCSDLADEARCSIEQLITLFRAFEAASHYDASRIRKQLRKLIACTTASHSLLLELMANPHALAALTVTPTLVWGFFSQAV